MLQETLGESLTRYLTTTIRTSILGRIVNERDFRYMSLRGLLDEQSAHAGLRLAHSLAAAPGQKILVYELADTEPSAHERPEGTP